MINARRFWLTCALTMGGFLFLIVRLGYLQLYCHAALRQRADRGQARRVKEMPARGAILDRAGGSLAMSLRGGACFADPLHVRQPDETARLLSPLLNMSAAAIKTKLTQRKRFVWLARRLDPAMTKRIQSLRRPGIVVLPEMKRFYPEETLAAHTLGVIGNDYQGLSGVEQVADGWLRGRSVPFLFKQWSYAKETPAAWNSRTDLQPRSVVLTLDRTLQYIAEQELAVQMRLSRPRSGTVIIQDPRTGEILAMASAPTFNPNVWGLAGQARDYGPEDLKNPGVEKVIEPGSTYKLVTAAAALERGVVQPNDGFNCEKGAWKIQGRTINDHEKDGWLTFTQIMSRSSNIGTAKVALRLGQDGLYQYSRAFGFGVPSGCGLPGDGAGILRVPQQWRTGSLITIAFGQEVAVTPLQMVNAYGVIANGGMLLEPRLYKGTIDERGEYREWVLQPPIRRVISPRTVRIMRSILQDVVNNGTGKAAQVAGISVAGKTGTAQKIDPATRRYSPDRYVASFCGFAPVEQPRLVIGVFLDEPQTNYWGGSEAAPLFARILRAAAAYLPLQPAPVGPLAASRTIPPS